MFVREFTDGLEIEQVLMVREVERRQKRDGGEFLRLALGDRTGSVTAMVWDGVADVVELVVARLVADGARATALLTPAHPARVLAGAGLALPGAMVPLRAALAQASA